MGDKVFQMSAPTNSDSLVSKVSSALRADRNAVAVVEKEVQGNSLTRYVSWGSEYKWAAVQGRAGAAKLVTSLGLDDFEEADVEIQALSEVPTTVRKQIENVRNNDPSESAETHSGEDVDSDVSDDIVKSSKGKYASDEIDGTSSRKEDYENQEAMDGLHIGAVEGDDRNDENW